MDVGGSFGSKHVLGKVIGIAAMLAKRDGPRREVHGGPRRQPHSPARTSACDRFYDAELAVTADGTFTGLRIKVVDDYGAYFQFGHGTHGNALAQATGPYRIAASSTASQCVLTNKCQQGVFRGAGSDANNFALERLVDAAAQELGWTAWRSAARNFIQPDAFPFKIAGRQHLRQRRLSGGARPGARHGRLGRAAAMQARRAREGRLVGIGLATAQQRSVYGPTEFWFWYDAAGLTSVPESVGLSVGPDRRVHRDDVLAVLGQQPGDGRGADVAEEFGIDPSSVSVTYDDSLHGLPSAGPGGSRMTVMLTAPSSAPRAS